MTTRNSNFKKDASGLYHFKNTSQGNTTLHWNISDAILFALENRPNEPYWFWWNDTPALMAYNDT